MMLRLTPSQRWAPTIYREEATYFFPNVCAYNNFTLFVYIYSHIEVTNKVHTG